MEKLIKEKNENLRQIEALKNENKKLEESISVKEKSLDTSILKRNIAKSGEYEQKEKLERFQNTQKEKKEAFETAIGVTLATGIIGTIATSNIDEKLVAPAVMASIAIGASVGIGKLIVYKRFLSKNSEEDIALSQLRCHGIRNSALREILSVSEEIKGYLTAISENNDKIEALINRNNKLSLEIGRSRRETSPIIESFQKVKK